MAPLEQVVGGQPAAEDVVHRDRALVRAGRPAVDQHHRHAAVAQRRRARGRAPAVGVIEHALDAAARSSTSRCAASLAGRSSELQRMTARPSAFGDLLDAAGDVGEERVGDVEHDQADGAAAAGAQLAGRLVADEAQRRRWRRAPAARVASLTVSGRLSTLLTVPTETPACPATSRMLVVRAVLLVSL